MVKDFLSQEKKIYDPIHGFIRFDEIERKLIDSLPFQRLHYIHQLGIAYLVYPGATQTRFEHSLGVMELATSIYKKICKTVRPDSFHFVPRKGSIEYIYWKKVLRIASLCHDLGHLPFSHLAEKDILQENGHEFWTLKIMQSPYLKDVFKALQEDPVLQKDFTHRDIVQDIIKVALGEKKLNQLHPGKNISFTAWERILSEIISGDFFGADRMDYLLRDAKSTGIVYGLFDYKQLIEMLRILPNPSGRGEDLRLGIDINGLESCEALLLARLFMHKRVYQYSSIKAYTFHLRRFMRIQYANSLVFEDIDKFIFTSDINITSDLYHAMQNKDHKAYFDANIIIKRQGRFQAIALPENITEDFLKDFQEKNGIESSMMEWEFQEKDVSKKDFSFPVSVHHFLVKEAKDCSSLLASIPSSSYNWLYIAPQYEELFLQSIN